MPPNMDEVLLPPHSFVVPSPAEPSNEELVFGMVEVHTEEFQGDPFPVTQHILSYFTFYRHEQAPLRCNIF
jgi:hypothetical protein